MHVDSLLSLFQKINLNAAFIYENCLLEKQPSINVWRWRKSTYLTAGNLHKRVLVKYWLNLIASLKTNNLPIQSTFPMVNGDQFVPFAIDQPTIIWLNFQWNGNSNGVLLTTNIFGSNCLQWWFIILCKCFFVWLWFPAIQKYFIPWQLTDGGRMIQYCLKWTLYERLINNGWESGKLNVKWFTHLESIF